MGLLDWIIVWFLSMSNILIYESAQELWSDQVEGKDFKVLKKRAMETICKNVEPANLVKMLETVTEDRGSQTLSKSAIRNYRKRFTFVYLWGEI